MDRERIMEKETEFPEKYNHHSQEPYWQRWWKKEGIFRFNPDNPRPLFTIDTPPPTISGRLHLGHAFSYSQAEVAAAYLRMAGFNVRYPFGLDNNGLPTERLGEKEKRVDPFRSGVSEFNRVCLDVVSRSTPEYKEFFERLGFRWDLNLEYSTISPEVQRLSQEVFLKLYKDGLIYRKDSPVLYCPECKTSVAQAEVEDKEQPGIFYDLIFRKPDGGELIIATTRPELLPACVAVFVHPDDERYKNIIGSKIETPLGEKVKVLSDDKVSPEKGTGIVMCCTYGDTTDVYWTKTHGLPEKIILDKEGRFIDRAVIPEEMRGKTIKEGRKMLTELLKEKGLIKVQKPITHEVGVHERCGTPIEIISTPQWFVKILEMKPQLLAAADKINWYPPYMKKRYLEWVNGLTWDWCISRGRFFGIPIPVFYCQDCQEIILPKPEELPIDPRLDQKRRSCPHCKSVAVQPEEAVLDTWFTSALTPEINNNHHLNGPLTGKMYPMSMRPHGHDIIRSWTTYSILMGLLLHDQVPWKDLMISGHILAKKGEKISKKTGGGSYDPVELAEKYSADALRYVLFGGALGKDVYFDEEELRKGKRLVIKIYNAGRFALSNLQDFNPRQEIDPSSFGAIDRWILFRTQEAAAKMGREFERYEFGKARQIFEDFFWKDFCDNYLEIIKGRIYGKDEKPRRSGQYALYLTYLSVLKMIAPLLPHISEEMYHCYYEQSLQGLRLNSNRNKGYFFRHERIPSIHLSLWPSISFSFPQVDNEIKSGVGITLSLIEKIRKANTEIKRDKKPQFTRILVLCDSSKQYLLSPFLGDIGNFAKVAQINLAEQAPPEIPPELLLISL